MAELRVPKGAKAKTPRVDLRRVFSREGSVYFQTNSTWNRLSKCGAVTKYKQSTCHSVVSGGHLVYLHKNRSKVTLVDLATGKTRTVSTDLPGGTAKLVSYVVCSFDASKVFVVSKRVVRERVPTRLYTINTEVPHSDSDSDDFQYMIDRVAYECDSDIVTTFSSPLGPLLLYKIRRMGLQLRCFGSEETSEMFPPRSEFVTSQAGDVVAFYVTEDDAQAIHVVSLATLKTVHVEKLVEPYDNFTKFGFVDKRRVSVSRHSNTHSYIRLRDYATKNYYTFRTHKTGNFQHPMLFDKEMKSVYMTDPDGRLSLASVVSRHPREEEPDEPPAKRHCPA